MPATSTTCPHCGAALQRVKLPLEAAYDEPVHLVCFNDDCSYYREGWEWMLQQYNAKASYRYRVEPLSGVASPLPVWAPEALRDRLVVDEAPARRPPAKARTSPRRPATKRSATQVKGRKARGRPQSRGRKRGR